MGAPQNYDRLPMRCSTARQWLSGKAGMSWRAGSHSSNQSQPRRWFWTAFGDAETFLWETILHREPPHLIVGSIIQVCAIAGGRYRLSINHGGIPITAVRAVEGTDCEGCGHQWRDFPMRSVYTAYLSQLYLSPLSFSICAVPMSKR